MPIKASWHKIKTTPSLPRSSHSLNIIKGRAYIFGGESNAQEPVDSAVHAYTLPSGTVEDSDYNVFYDDRSEAPPPRVGHTAVTIADRIYLFGGREGKDMMPLEENGRVWVLDTAINKWTHFDPLPGSTYPEARSYHASAANEHPLPSEVTTSAGAGDVAPHGTVFIHGGCTAEGRTSDIWSFDVQACAWSRFPDAPGPARSGAALTFAQDRIYRYGGFDGDAEIGGQIDYLEITKSFFEDTDDRGEMALFTKTGEWKTVMTDTQKPMPGGRSSAGLHPVTTGQGRNYLVLVLGERVSSNKGNEEAGNFYDDVWCYQIRPDGWTGASFKDATRQLVGAKTEEGTWAKVDVPEFSKQEARVEHPGPRGWFASAQEDVDKKSVVVWGGINSANEKQGDGYILTID
ncbi:MAG: hypothetical protein MMC23_000017 [Stictis urceolatum]|nr:hypothetical protein [Stictis urceolata]